MSYFCLGICVCLCLCLLAWMIVLYDSQQQMKQELKKLKDKNGSTEETVIDVREVLEVLVKYLDKKDKNKP